MPNDRRRPRAAKRVALLPRLRAAPVLLLGLVAVAVLGRTPPGEQSVRWTLRDAGVWMNEFDGLREARTAALEGPSTVVATFSVANPAVVVAAAEPVARSSGDHTGAAMVVAEADLLPRDVPKTVPRDAAEPEITGVVPPRMDGDAAAPAVETMPVVNRTNKGDRLLNPRPLGRTTDRDLFVKPTLATVPPTQEGWPPLVTVASLTGTFGDATLPRQALAAPDRKGAEDRIVVAMVRTGPGRVVTQSAIAALGTTRAKGHPLLPPVPEAQVAGVNPRTQIWAQPAVPEIGYAKRATDLLARFRSVLGDEDAQTPAEAPRETPPDEMGG